MSKERIPTGSEVTWHSQAGGAFKKKVGIVIDYIPRDVSAEVIWEKHLKQVKYSPMTIQRYSTFNRYLVEVQIIGKRGQLLKPKYYSPHAGVVERSYEKQKAESKNQSTLFLSIKEALSHGIPASEIRKDWRGIKSVAEATAHDLSACHAAEEAVQDFVDGHLRALGEIA